MPQEPVVNADETGHRTNGDKRWLWVFVAHTFVLYRIAADRGSAVLTAVLGETFAGVLGSDRLPSYLKYVAAQRQLCWAHLTRNLLSALDLARTPSARASVARRWYSRVGCFDCGIAIGAIPARGARR